MSPELGEDIVRVSSETFIPDEESRPSTPGLTIIDDDVSVVPSLGNGIEQAIDVDGPEQKDMANQFGGMNLSADADFERDLQRATEESLKLDVQYSRKTASMRDDTIDMDEPFESISAALKRKYTFVSEKPVDKPTTRRTSSKIIPLTSYVPLDFY
jgi:hypothetical protein